MSHGVGPQHPAENGRTEVMDDSGEFPHHLAASLQYSPIHQYVPQHHHQLHQQRTHHQQQQQEPAYQFLIQPPFRGGLDPNNPVAYTQIYYPPHPVMQFNPYMMAQHQQQPPPPPTAQQQHPQQQVSVGNQSQDLTTVGTAGSDITNSSAAMSQHQRRPTYAQKASHSESSDSGHFNAPGRGVPVQTSQPAMLQPKQHEPTHPQQVAFIANPRSGTQFKVSDYLPQFLHEMKPEILINEVNPPVYMPPHVNSRFFVIKSYSEEDVHRAIKYSIWCSSKKNNETLNKTYQEVMRDSGASCNSSAASTPSSTNADCDGNSYSAAFLKDQPMVYLFFSVNGSGHFCGVSRLSSKLYEHYNAGVWCQEKWTGLFYIRWLYVKDVPNAHLRHIRLENNENKPVTNTRDGHEVDFDNGVKVLKVIHHFQYTTTLFDDYDHYDRLEEDKYRRKETQSNRLPKN